ncbi:MAG TPA: glycosyltransferase family 87 protein [Acidimicrobiales bacterium]|nr:glycosyltransferase family 87 protein [Acidimicrobiales bacterium]
MSGAPTGAVEGRLRSAGHTSWRAFERLLAAIDRHAVACSVAGVGVLGLLSWYVAWHVPHSGWLFTSHYDAGFKDLIYRIRNVDNARQGGVLYATHIGVKQYFVYPPATLWLFWPLTWVSGQSLSADAHFTGVLLWSFATLLALAWMIASAARYACRWRWPKAWAVSLLVAAPLSALVLQPVGVHLALGQVGLFLAAAATFDLLCVRDERWRGALTGVTAALKLYPIVYFVIFALRREWRALANAVGAMLATTALAWVVFPSYSATYFFHRLLGGSELRHYWHVKHWISSSSSLYTLFFRQPFTGSAPERDLGLVLCAAVIALGVYAAWRQLREGREVAAFLCVALASTIGSPVAWDHYFIWVVLVPFVLVEAGALPWWRVTSLGLFGLTCLVPLRLARNEDLSHKAYDGVFVVIFLARNGLAAVSLLWLVVASVPWRGRAAPQASAATTASHQARTAG